MKEELIGLLRWMLSQGMIGGKHTPEGRVMKRIAHLPRDEQNLILKEWEHCIKQLQWIYRMKKTGEWHVSLNPKALSEIRQTMNR